MISKTLHVVWVGPHDPPMDLIDSWRVQHPLSDGWEFVLHRDHRGGWEVVDQIAGRAARREWNGVADVMRWEILYKMGGIVVDADSECLRQLDKRFLEPDAWASYEHETLRPGLIACGAMGGVQGGAFFKACFEMAKAADPGVPAGQAVGPGLITAVAKTMPGLKVFPSYMFCPTHFSGAKSPGAGRAAVGKEAFADQKWGSTKGYSQLRKKVCSCPECNISMLRPPWG